MIYVVHTQTTTLLFYERHMFQVGHISDCIDVTSRPAPDIYTVSILLTEVGAKSPEQRISAKPILSEDSTMARDPRIAFWEGLEGSPGWQRISIRLWSLTKHPVREGGTVTDIINPVRSRPIEGYARCVLDTHHEVGGCTHLYRIIPADSSRIRKYRTAKQGSGSGAHYRPTTTKRECRRRFVHYFCLEVMVFFWALCKDFATAARESQTLVAQDWGCSHLLRRDMS